MKNKTILKNYEIILKDWFMGNCEDSKLLDYILNYGLSNKFKDIEIQVRQVYGH